MSTFFPNDILNKWKATLDPSPENGWWDFKEGEPDSPVSRVKHACEGVETSMFSFLDRYSIRDGLN